MSELMVVSGFNPGKKDLLTIIILTNRKIVIYNTNQKVVYTPDIITSMRNLRQ